MFSKPEYADNTSIYENEHHLPAKYYSSRDMSYLDRLIFTKPKMVPANFALILSSIVVAVMLSSLAFIALGNDSDNIPPLIFGSFIIFFFMLQPLAIVLTKIKSIEIKSDGLLIRKSAFKSFTIGFNEFEQIIPFRHYNSKYGTYTSTSYQIAYFANGKRKKLNLFDMNPLQGSEFIHEVYKAYILFKNGNYADYNVDPSILNRDYYWNTDEPKSNSIIAKKNNLFYAFIGIMITIPPLIVIVAMFGHYGISPMAIVATLAIIIFIGLINFLSITSSSRANFYASNTINRLSVSSDILTIDSQQFRKNDIESIQISKPSYGDPKCGGNAVLLIVTRSRLYKYETYVINENTRNTLRKLKTNPSWSYQDFYQIITSWGKYNSVRVMDYVV